MHARIRFAAVTIALGAVAAFPAPAQAATQHCDSALYPNKVELVNAGPSYQTDLPAGTEVCIKSSTRTTIVTVDENGVITNTEITNKNGKAQGISYFAYGETETGSGS